MRFRPLLIAVTLAGCATYASVEPTYVDASPLLGCTLDPDAVASRFADYRVHPDREVRLAGEAGANEVRVASHDFFVSSLDGRTGWSTRAAVLVYASAERAAEAFRSHCEVYAAGYPAELVRISGAAEPRTCLTPLGRLRSDAGTWTQAAVVQRESVVVSLLQTRHGANPDKTPFADVVADVAKRLCVQPKHRGHVRGSR